MVNNLVKYAKEAPSTSFVAYSNLGIPRKQIDATLASTTLSKFSFDEKDNLYSTVRRLKAKMPEDTSCIIATDYLELVMVQLCRLKLPVVYIVLGDFEYYYQTVEKFEGVIDTFICISNEINQKLLTRLPHRQKDIVRIYFPTPPVEKKRADKLPGDPLKLVYVARLEEGKNPLILHTIDELLIKQNVSVEWEIVGDGPLKQPLMELIGHKKNFRLHGFLSNEQLHDLYPHQDVFILTSDSEGLPVSLIEAMKTGLVPVVSNIAGGTKEIVKEGNNGFLCEVNNAADFANHIALLYSEPDVYRKMAGNALCTGEQLFNPYENCQQYWDVFRNTNRSTRKKKYTKIPMSSLDLPWLPNGLVRFIRSLK